MHDYFIKQNFTNAANATVVDALIREEEGLPVTSDGPESLLFQWFSAFWDSYTGLNGMPSSYQAQSLLSQPIPRPYVPAQQNSAFKMRRTDSEPVRTKQNSIDLDSQRPDVPSFTDAGQFFPQGSYSAARRYAAQSGASKPMQRQIPDQRGSSDLSSQDTVAMMQKMGWGGRPIEVLNGEERISLASALARSRVAQQQASHSMTQAHSNRPVDLSRGPHDSRG
jgi:hypothetical protein